MTVNFNVYLIISKHDGMKHISLGKLKVKLKVGKIFRWVAEPQGIGLVGVVTRCTLLVSSEVGITFVLILYKVLRSVLTYAASVWGNAAPKYNENLKYFQKERS
jgi:hypothetical protein